MYDGVPLKQPPDTPTGSFAFVMNVNGSQLTEPLELIPGHVLRKPSRAQCDEIRSLIPNLDGRLPSWFEQAILRTQTGGWATGPELDEDEWRYAIVELTASHDRTELLQLAANLCQAELELPMVRRVQEDGAHTAVDFGVIGKVFRPPPVFYFRPFGATDATELRELADAISRHDDSVLRLSPELERFETLRTLDRPEFVFLGYFTIVESLLAHKPLPEDRYDSISRQVVGKMSLLGGRFDGGFDTTEWFDTLSAEKMWKQLYAFRSCIAHGTEPNFDKDLKSLKRSSNAIGFMKHTTKKLLRHALKEPKLIRDLKGVTI